MSLIKRRIMTTWHSLKYVVGLFFDPSKHFDAHSEPCIFAHRPYIRTQVLVPARRDFTTLSKEESTLTMKSFLYNNQISNKYALNTTMEQLYWLKNNFVKSIEKVLVAGLIILTVIGVFFCYWIGLPYWWEKSPCVTVFLVIIGNWILINIIFHYYMGLTTPPGYPPRNKHIIENAVTICKKCIAPKLPRTHHCSVCDTCILQMDHHCPWLNNCIGVFNARYFFLYTVYMLLGIIFIFLCGVEIVYVVIWLKILEELFDANFDDYSIRTNESDFVVSVDRTDMPENDDAITQLTEVQRIAADPLKSRVVLYFGAILTDGLIGLIVLIYIHVKNISRGQTSIESHSNHLSRQKCGREFRNPYDLGFWKNWQLFLGLVDGRTFVRHILFPSAHKPCSDGITFQTGHNNRGSC